MRHQIEAMKQITKRYQLTIEKLELLREQELLFDNELTTGRLEGDRLEQAQQVIVNNRKKAGRLVSKLLPGFTIDN